MIELLMVAVGGVLGSGHCVGMCGPIALTVAGPAPDWRANLRRQLVFSAGRIFTYATAGAVAGYVGMRMTGHLTAVVNVQALLALLAGAMLIAQGLLSAGVISWPRRGRLPACLAPGLLGTFLREPGLASAFLAGVFTGFLPCGLVYAFVALAATAGSAAAGMAHMAAFGAGTVPLLVAVGTGGSVLSLASRQRALRVAACFVILTGAVSVLRGAGYLGPPQAELPAGCPLCAP